MDNTKESADHDNTLDNKEIPMKRVQKTLKLKIYNTLSNSIEDFVPIEPDKIKMYAC
jgi:hypothetical protein